MLRFRMVYLGLGDKERALDGLDQAYEAGSRWLTWLKVDQMFDPLCSEPRFIALLKKVSSALLPSPEGRFVFASGRCWPADLSFATFRGALSRQRRKSCK